MVSLASQLSLRNLKSRGLQVLSLTCSSSQQKKLQDIIMAEQLNMTILFKLARYLSFLFFFFSKDLPGVIRVIPNQLHSLQTTRSWDYLGFSPNSPTNLLNEANLGDGIIIGLLDTGFFFSVFFFFLNDLAFFVLF